MHGEFSAGGSPSKLPAVWLGVVGAGGVLLAVNSAMTVFKETPAFWHDAGGYPVAMRDLVLTAYYPLLGLNTLLCLAVGALVLVEYRRLGRGAWWALVVGAVMWLMLGLNVGWLVENNVENLLLGRELHYHPPTAD